MYIADRPVLLRMLLEFPYLATPSLVIDVALDLVSFSSGETFADLGCGDGMVLIRVAERFGVFSVGFEIDRRLVMMAKENARSAGVGNLIDVVESDLFRADISKFNVIYIYPFPPIVQRLSEKMLDECGKGARILVHDYSLVSLHPAKVVCTSEGGMRTHRIYLYEL